MNTTTQLIKKQIDEALTDFFAHKREQFSSKDSQFHKELDMLASFVLRGGKRLRPLLVAGAYLLQSEKFAPRIARAALAYELVHAGLLIHDDIIDQDSVRRGNPTVHIRYEHAFNKYNIAASEAVHHGMSVAIVIGDLAISLAYELLHEGTKGDPVAFELFQQSLYQVYDGEILDIYTKFKSASMNDVLRSYYLKTAGYSFIGPMLLGAQLAKLHKEDRVLLEQLGESCGLAFQILDDIKGAFAKETDIGKPVYSDFKEGKQTVLTLYALKKAQPRDQEYIRQTLGNPKLTRAEGMRLCQIIRESGALDYALKTVKNYVTGSYGILEKLPESKGRLVLWDIVEYMDNNTHYD